MSSVILYTQLKDNALHLVFVDIPWDYLPANPSPPVRPENKKGGASTPLLAATLNNNNNNNS